MDSPSVKQTIEDRIELALEESNAALDNSGITSAELRFRIVHVYYEPSYVETNFSSTLSQTTSRLLASTSAASVP